MAQRTRAASMLAAGWRGAGVVKASVEDVNLRHNWEVWASPSPS
jgi:hypothetical protein